ncbi:DUF1698 domain-containing protein [Loktanella sp. IMCC34160]|uniref:class I SAM-dependent methyltransferase n=1 Tax=Loktanella sp. IMCC34160 TaxID=2510646 RepID=UPI0013EA38F8|nr:DUF1698 domain-containing protein [Loktanella sp. IMCC34160]
MRISERIKRLFRWFQTKPAQNTDALTAKFEYREPHPQNALDLMSGWAGSFPDDLELTAGTMALHADPRLHWALDRYGSLEGKRVLELGPLEGSHTYLVERRGAGEILAIEGNKQAFLRCLITKEILGLTRSRFLLGDFVRYLEQMDQTFDVILASGILYHMHNPVEVLDNIGKKCRALILWTHYFDSEVMHEDDPRRTVFSREPVAFEHRDHVFRLHRRSYYRAWDQSSYCGGPDDVHFWMERPDIIALCKRNGFDNIQIGFEETDGPNGPSCLFLMTKSAN